MRTLRPMQLLVLVSTLLIVGGGLYLGIPWLQSAWQRQQGTQYNDAALQTATRETVAVSSFALHDPVQVELPRLHITLAIKPGTYNKATQSWSLDRNSAFVMQPWTDQRGLQLPMTPVIYGHNIPAVFTPLRGAAPNELLIITERDGTKYTLRYVNDVVVSPYDNSIFMVRYRNSVLLMTCTGSHFESRRVLHFELVGQGKGA